jgi:hypothetical protein
LLEVRREDAPPGDAGRVQEVRRAGKGRHKRERKGKRDVGVASGDLEALLIHRELMVIRYPNSAERFRKLQQVRSLIAERGEVDHDQA